MVAAKPVKGKQAKLGKASNQPSAPTGQGMAQGGQPQGQPLQGQSQGKNPDSLQQIADRLSTLRFRKSIWGANEQDVWAKIRRLDEMYRLLYRDQEAKYLAVVKERNALRQEVLRLRAQQQQQQR